MAGGVLLPDYTGTTPGTTVGPGFPGVIRGALSGQSVFTLPPPASGGLSGPLAGVTAIPSRVAASVARQAPVGLAGRPGKAKAGLARARAAVSRAGARALAVIGGQRA